MNKNHDQALPRRCDVQPPLRRFGFALAIAPLSAAACAWFLDGLFFTLRFAGARDHNVFEFFFGMFVSFFTIAVPIFLVAIPIAYAAAAFVSLPFLALARLGMLRLWSVLLLSVGTGYVAVLLFWNPRIREPYETSADILLMSTLLGGLPGAVFGATFWALLRGHLLDRQQAAG